MKLIIDFEDAEIFGKWPISNNICCLIPTYNHENYIEDNLNGILTQNNVDFHILIHDDASTDSTLQKIQSIQNKKPDQITVISQKTNQRSKGIPILARLINSINSEFIAICEGDDYWNDNDKLIKQLNYFRNHPDCGLVFSDIEIENTSENYEYKNNLRKNLSWITDQKTYGNLELSKGNFIMTCTVLFLKKAIRPEFLNSMHDVLPGDWLLFSNISEKYKLYYINEKLATYRIHKSNTWANSTSSHQTLNLINAMWFASSRMAETARPYFQIELIKKLWESNEIKGYDNPIYQYKLNYNELNNKYNELNNNFNQTINSRSWRLTQPLRWIKSKTKGIKKGKLE